jgi:hypothetical protein
MRQQPTSTDGEGNGYGSGVIFDVSLYWSDQSPKPYLCSLGGSIPAQLASFDERLIRVRTILHEPTPRNIKLYRPFIEKPLIHRPIFLHAIMNSTHTYINDNKRNKPANPWVETYIASTASSIIHPVRHECIHCLCSHVLPFSDSCDSHGINCADSTYKGAIIHEMIRNNCVALLRHAFTCI